MTARGLRQVVTGAVYLCAGGVVVVGGLADTSNGEPENWAVGACFVVDPGPTPARVPCDLPDYEVLRVYYVVPGAQSTSERSVAPACRDELPPMERDHADVSFSSFGVDEDGVPAVVCAVPVRGDR